MTTRAAGPRRVTRARRRILVIDIGGAHVKLLASGQRTPLWLPSGPALTPDEMAAAVRDATRGWDYDVISMGYPGPVHDHRPAVEPHNLGPGWVGFDYDRALGHPVRVINDAAMQALGGYTGGHMLFLGLGTGLGSALIVEGLLQPLELAHLPYRGGRTFEEWVGEAGRRRAGARRWRRTVVDVVRRLRMAMQADWVLLGGGNARRFRTHLDELPEGTRLGSNADAFRGGMRLWKPPEERVKLALKRA